MDQVIEWFGIESIPVGVLAGVAAVTWVLTLLLVPWFIARLPADYFISEKRRPVYADSLHPLIGWSLAALKNGMGAVLITFGLIMLFTPGQGLATVLVGIMLLNFPGKYKLERSLAQRPAILRSLNWLRARLSKPLLEAPPHDHQQPPA